MVEVHGWAGRRYAAVADAFAANFAQHGDVGAACAVYRDGTPVVDLWGGVADHVTGRPWTEDTVQVVFSATKGLTAACVHLLVERGQLALDDPIATRWPGFAAAGKGAIPLRWALCHKAGLAAVDGELTLPDVLAWDPVVEAIATQAPNWEPGTAHGYHMRSFGWILGEVVRRTTRRSLGRFFADEIARPLGLDCWIGLPEDELGRCARLIPPATPPPIADLVAPDSLTARVWSGPSHLFAYDEMWNRPEILRAEMPSSNGVMGARALARFYAALAREVDGVRLLAPDTLSAARIVQAEGPDLVLLLPTSFGLGFVLQPMLAPGAGARALGHPGAGGSLGFVDPEAGIGFGYVTTRMQFDLAGDPRTRALVAALYGALSA
jgi:CubicO group peptidase (beta-lactamase class C family)